MRNEEKVMKKELLVLLASVLTFYTGKTVSAKETYQLLGVNPAGEYYVEQESLEKALQKEKGGLLEQVKTKAVLKDQNFIRLLGETYEKKLEDNDKRFPGQSAHELEGQCLYRYHWRVQSLDGPHYQDCCNNQHQQFLHC